jgi:hypothetical protein
MCDAVRECFRRSQDRARAVGKGLRLRLRIEEPALATLPWEYLFDPACDDFVCLSSDTPVVRYLEFDRPPEPLTITPPLSVLGVVANPSDRGTLDVARERERVDVATRALRDAGLLRVTWLDGSTPRDLQRAMRRGPFHVLHFVGHGGFDTTTREGFIALTDDAGRTDLVSATQLGRVLADHRSLRLVVLNSCHGARGCGTDVFSSTAATLVRRGLPAVIAMQHEISDHAAIEFARALYEAVADGLPVDAAVAEARKSVSLAADDSVEWGTPVLHMRSPDGVLFRITGPTTSTRIPGGRTGELRMRTVAGLSTSGSRPVAAPAPAPGVTPTPASVVDPDQHRVRRTLLRVTPLAVAASMVAMLLWSRGAPGPGMGHGGSSDGASDTASGTVVMAGLGAAPSVAATGTVRTAARTAAHAPRAGGPGTITAAPDDTPPRFAPNEQARWRWAQVTSFAVVGQGQGEWQVRLGLRYPSRSRAVGGDVTCVLRPGDPEERVVAIPVVLASDTEEGEFKQIYRTTRDWRPGSYPARCTAQSGDTAWTGRLTVH